MVSPLLQPWRLSAWRSRPQRHRGPCGAIGRQGFTRVFPNVHFPLSERSERNVAINECNIANGKAGKRREEECCRDPRGSTAEGARMLRNVKIILDCIGQGLLTSSFYSGQQAAVSKTTNASPRWEIFKTTQIPFGWPTVSKTNTNSSERMRKSNHSEADPEQARRVSRSTTGRRRAADNMARLAAGCPVYVLRGCEKVWPKD